MDCPYFSKAELTKKGYNAGNTDHHVMPFFISFFSTHCGDLKSVGLEAIQLYSQTVFPLLALEWVV